MQDICVEPVLNRDQQAVVDSSKSLLTLSGSFSSGKTTALSFRAKELAKALPAYGSVVFITPHPKTLLTHHSDRLSASNTVTLSPLQLAKLTLEEQHSSIDNRAISCVSRLERVELLDSKLTDLQLRKHEHFGRPTQLVHSLLCKIDALKSNCITDLDLETAISTWELTNDQNSHLDVAKEKEFLHIYRFHDRLLKELGLIDINDLILAAVKQLLSSEDVDDASLKTLLVDDLDSYSRLELKLLNVFASTCGSVTTAYSTDRQLAATQDPDATKYLVETEKIELTTAPGELPAVRTAADLIDTNSKLVTPNQSLSSAIFLRRAPSMQSLLKNTAAHICSQLQTDPTQNIVIATPSLDRYGRSIVAELTSQDVEAVLLKGRDLLHNPVVRNVAAWLRILNQPADSVAGVRALSSTPIDLNAAGCAKLLQTVRRKRTDVLTAAEIALDSTEPGSPESQSLNHFIAIHREFSALLDSSKPTTYIQRLLQNLSYLHSDPQILVSLDTQTARDLGELLEYSRHYTKKYPTRSAREFAEHFGRISELAQITLEGLDPFAYSTTDRTQTAPKNAVKVVALSTAATLEIDHLYILGADAAQLPGPRLRNFPPLPAELIDNPELTATNRKDHFDSSSRLLSKVVARARKSVVLSYLSKTEGAKELAPSPLLKRVQEETDLEWVEYSHEPLKEEINLHLQLQKEALQQAEYVGRRLGELKLETTEGLDHALVSYAELIKATALNSNFASTELRDTLGAVNSTVLQHLTPAQANLFKQSKFDDSLLSKKVTNRAVFAEQRERESLTPFLPKHGKDGLILSASDVVAYQSCPLRYKYARILKIPSSVNANQWFGILMHQVLERFHSDKNHSLAHLLQLLETSWHRSSIDELVDGLSLRAKATEALTKYFARFQKQQPETAWIERSFKFELGPHLVRGRVDRIDKLADGQYELVDYKTGRPRSKSDLWDDIQLPLYSLAAKRAWGAEAKTLTYHYILDDTKVQIPTEQIDTDSVVEQMNTVAEHVQSQEFEPKPSFAACSNCHFKVICPASEC